MKLDRLERVIREALRSSIHYEKLAGKFKLMLYRRDASNLSKEIGAKVVLRQKRAASRRAPAQMVRLGGLTGMTKPESKIPWEVKQPAEIKPDQVANAINALVLAYTADPTERHIVPLDGISEEARGVLQSHAFYQGQAGIDDVERRVRSEMKAKAVDEKEIKALKLAVFMRWAKDLQGKLVAQEKRKAARARAAHGKTDAGREDTELNAVKDLPTGVQLDALSGSMPLMAHAVLAQKFRERLWYDEFYHALMTDWDGSQDDRQVPTQMVTDRWRSNAYFTLMRSNLKLAKVGPTAAQSAIDQFAFQDVRNAPRDWIKTLKWDGVMRLPTWLSVVYGTPQDAYHEAVGRNWFVGMAARIMDHGCKMDTMPVLISEEGYFKSTSLEIIGGKVDSHGEHWYANLIVSADKTTDFLMTLNGTIISEVAELQALMNRKVEHAHVKNLLSTREDKYRAPYGRGPEPHRRTCVICASTNEWHFNDFEGKARRFWPFEVMHKADTEWLIANRTQMFAEALERYTRGETWYEVPEAEHARHIQEHRIEDPVAERITAWIADRPHLYTGTGCGRKPVRGDTTEQEYEKVWGNLITTNRLMVEVLKVDGVAGSNAITKRVTSAMQNMGWKRQTVSVASGRGAPTASAWVKDALKQSQLFDKER